MIAKRSWIEDCAPARGIRFEFFNDTLSAGNAFMWGMAGGVLGAFIFIAAIMIGAR